MGKGETDVEDRRGVPEIREKVLRRGETHRNGAFNRGDTHLATQSWPGPCLVRCASLWPLPGWGAGQPAAAASRVLPEAAPQRLPRSALPRLPLAARLLSAASRFPVLL